MKKIAAEFKEFIMRGNVMDMAVGVIIGGAFQAIVTALINDLIMPLIGLITGGINFTELFVILKCPPEVDPATVTYATAADLGVSIWGYGSFITAVINFLVMAIIVFAMVKGINKLSRIGKKKEEEEEEPTTKTCPHCFEEVNIKATKCPHCTGDIPEEE